MKRWISSVCCTLCLVAAAFLLPGWTVPRQLEEGEAMEDSAISTVALIQRTAAAPPPVVQAPPELPKPVSPHLPTVPSREEVPPEPVVDTAVEPLQDEPPPEEATAAAAGTEDGSTTAQDAAATAGARTESSDPAALQYRQYVLSRIASKKTYPRSARIEKQEGVVRLQVVIGKDGRLMDCKIVSPCQHSLLNEASLLAVEKAAPFKRMPADMDTLTLTFAIDYSLQ